MLGVALVLSLLTLAGALLSGLLVADLRPLPALVVLTLALAVLEVVARRPFAVAGPLPHALQTARLDLGAARPLVVFGPRLGFDLLPTPLFGHELVLGAFVAYQLLPERWCPIWRAAFV